MISCVMPPQLPVSTMVPCLQKRPRSSTEDAMSINRLLKSQKRSLTDSPRAAVMSPASETLPSPLAAVPVVKASWPTVTTSDSVKYAIAFLQDSRVHALGLLAQNQWQRALSVMEKVERANDMISRQRRKVVLVQANTTSSASESDTPRTRKVRFSDEVTVEIAADADRAPAKIPPFVREEILILRASRPIPSQNYSEFWG